MKKILLFDLDGTLTDPKEGITKCVQYALKSFGIEEELSKLLCFIGPPLVDSFREFYGFDEEKAKLSHLPTRLEDALDALEADHDYLTAGGVFPEELINNFIATKREECRQLAAIPHPAEFDRYYNL